MPIMRCKHCNYDLTGLADNRCPECGEAFDPDDPTTFEDGLRVPLRLTLSISALMVVAGCGGWTALMYFGPLAMFALGIVAVIIVILRPLVIGRF